MAEDNKALSDGSPSKRGQLVQLDWNERQKRNTTGSFAPKMVPPDANFQADAQHHLHLQYQPRSKEARTLESQAQYQLYAYQSNPVNSSQKSSSIGGGKVRDNKQTSSISSSQKNKNSYYNKRKDKTRPNHNANQPQIVLIPRKSSQPNLLIRTPVETINAL